MHHAAGLDGRGGSSHIDSVILRTTYTGTGGGVVEDKRFYYAQNWRADVSVVLDDAGVQQERVIYSPYGQPFAMPAGDTNFDGDFEAGVDGDELADWDINGVPYRAYADVNLDGDIDGADATAASEHDLGWNVLTSSGVNNRLGYAGYIHDRDVTTAAHVRYRVYKIDLGRWVQLRRPSSRGFGDAATSVVSASACGGGAVDFRVCQPGGDPPDPILELERRIDRLEKLLCSFICGEKCRQLPEGPREICFDMCYAGCTGGTPEADCDAECDVDYPPHLYPSLNDLCKKACRTGHDPSLPPLDTEDEVAECVLGCEFDLFSDNKKCEKDAQDAAKQPGADLAAIARALRACYETARQSYLNCVIDCQNPHDPDPIIITGPGVPSGD